MSIIADLQIHSRFSQATSKHINLENLEKYARIKGVNLLGTGDFVHPKWLDELKANLTEDGNGLLTSKTGFKFMLQGEISNIYTQGGKGRRIHTLLMAKSFEVVDQIQAALLKKGRLDYDGRPIFGFSCIELVEMMKEIDKDIEIIPAHIWTPWFGLLGSKSGFDSVEECFEEQSKHIYALETGLSSDPAMNRRLSILDKYTMVSNSDAHSFWPWRMGREATVYDTKWSYDAIIKAIRTGKGIAETIEVDPNYGKYHWDGHRECNVYLSPAESKKLGGICPKCKKPLTIGVEYRVEELADRPADYVHKGDNAFRNFIPLSEIISAVQGGALTTKKNWATFEKLIDACGSEFTILMETPEAELRKVVDEKIVQAILQTRRQETVVQPGYDGVYGVPQFEKMEQAVKKKKKIVRSKTNRAQAGLGEFL